MSRVHSLSRAGAHLLRGRGINLNAPMPARLAAAAMPRHANQFHWTSPVRMPYKDDQDRESLKPKAQEYVKSDEGGDDAAAQHADAAFNPNKTSPEAEKDAAGDGSNPLDVSPANPDLSAGKKQEGKASGQQKQTPSGGGGQKK